MAVDAATAAALWRAAAASRLAAYKTQHIKLRTSPVGLMDIVTRPSIDPGIFESGTLLQESQLHLCHRSHDRSSRIRCCPILCLPRCDRSTGVPANGGPATMQ